MALRIETLAIGDELLTVKIADTNSQRYVAGQLFANGRAQRDYRYSGQYRGHPYLSSTSFKERADVVVVFGGLGPTTDDLTDDCACRAIARTRPNLHRRVRALKKSIPERGRTVNADALRQVRYPRAAEPFVNEVGLAPRIYPKAGRVPILLLPGVPAEMRPMVEHSVLPGSTIVRKAARLLGPIPLALHGDCGVTVAQGLMHPVEATLPAYARIGCRTSPPGKMKWFCITKSSGRGFDSREFGEKICGDVRTTPIGKHTYSERYRTFEPAVVGVSSMNGYRAG
ncbi:MAG: molybdopterin-binding protein [Bdellovibrionota bacterium]